MIMLFGPCETMKEAAPKAQPKVVVKALDAVIIICDIVIFILCAMGII